MIILENGAPELSQYETRRYAITTTMCTHMTFWRAGGAGATMPVIETDNGYKARIPDNLIANYGYIEASATISDGNGSADVVDTGRFYVRENAIPDNYAPDDYESPVYQGLYALIRSMQSRMDAGEFIGETGPVGPQGDPAPADLVVPAVNAYIAEYLRLHPEATIDEDIIRSAVNAWLANHPEYVTTVMDNSISAAKLTAAVRENVEAVPGLKQDLTQVSESIAEIVTESTSKNLLDKAKATLTPYNYINPNGVTETYGNNFVTDYIPVETGKVVTISGWTPSGFVKRSYTSICLFDSNKNVKIGGDYNKNNYTVQSGVAFVRLTLNKSYCYDVSGMVELTTDGNPTTYEPYFDSIKKLTDNIIESSGLATVNYVDNKKFTLSSLTENIGCSLPIGEYFMTVGIPEDWFSASFVTPKGFVVNMYSGSEADRYNDRYAFANNRQYYGNNAYSWNLYDSLLDLVKKEAYTGYGYARNCKTLNLQNCTLLAIGDSTVDHDIMTAKIKSFFVENGKVCTLLGTLGDGKGTGNNNEGRAGWTTSDYFTNKTYNSVVNPFYNSSSQTFDFSYYMNNQGYTSVDFVAIQLGINDLYNFDDTKIVPTWENIKRMIDSIRSYDASVKVILNLPTTPNADQSKHSVFEPLYRNRVIRYCEYATRKAKELYSTNNVRVSYNHLILNPNTDIRDNVHPTNSGYEKMGLEVCNQINCWQNGY